jgi:hypothetical protein
MALDVTGRGAKSTSSQYGGLFTQDINRISGQQRRGAPGAGSAAMESRTHALPSVEWAYCEVAPASRRHV